MAYVVDPNGNVGYDYYGVHSDSCGHVTAKICSPFTEINSVAYPVLSGGDVIVVMETGSIKKSYGIDHFFCISFI